MAAKKEINADLEVLGNIKVSNVPNSIGSVVTYNSSTKLLGMRSSADVLTDLGVTASLNLKADKTTKVVAGTGLTGGGNLSSDRTLNIDSAFSPQTASKLSASADLNTINEGFYYQNANANTNTGTNYPTPLAGSFNVYKSAGVIQEYTTYTPSSEKYFRSIYGSYIGDWQKIWHDGHFSQTNINNWNTTFDWGNHVGLYLPLTGGTLTSNASPYTQAFNSHLNLKQSDQIEGAFVGISYSSSTASNYGWTAGAIRKPGGNSDFVFKNHFNDIEGVERVRISGSGTVSADTFIGNLTGNASTATKLANINTTFTGTYPLTANVNGAIYSHEGLTYTGSTGALAANTFIGALSGNATTASTLATARTINGTSFNGSANILTANWGTARNITIGNTTKSVNGSANVAWSLAEIGAASLTSLGDYYTKTETNDNFHKLAKNYLESTSAGYYATSNGELDNVLGNVSTYVSGGTIGGVARATSHIISYGVNASYGFQLLNSSVNNNPITTRKRINGVWQPEETLAYQSWVTQQTGNLPSLTTTNKNNLVDAINEVNGSIPNVNDFGGVNLIDDTHFYNGNANGWSSTYGTQVVENHIYKKTFDTLSSAARIERVFQSLKAGVYTLTIFVKTPQTIQWRGFVGGSPLIDEAPSAPNEFARRYVTFTVPADGNVTVRGYVSNIPIGSVIEIDWFKLETGYVGSDWTPALEEQKSDWNESDSTKYSFIKNKPLVVSVETDPIYTASVDDQVMFKSLIPNGEDLNTYEYTGVYGCNTNVVATSLLNCPSTSAFELTVKRILSTMIFQELTDHLSNDKWIRNKYSGTTWSTWRLLWSSKNFNPATKEDAFTKNTAFNKNFGTVAGTVAQGNHNHTFASLTSKPTTLAGYGIIGKETLKNDDSNFWPNSIPSDVQNYIDNKILSLTAGNSGLHLFGDATSNARRFGMQVSHYNSPFASAYGTLELNPFGGVVRINGSNITSGIIDNWNNAEPAFVKNTAFNKNFGDSLGTVAQGNDSRIVGAFNKMINALTITGDTNKTVTLTRQDGTTLVANFSDNNTESPDDVINTMSFNITTGVITAVTSLGATITTSIDGRFSLLGHTHSLSEIIGLVAALAGKEPTVTKGNLLATASDILLTGSGTGSLIGNNVTIGLSAAIKSAITTNTAKVSNVTHTGDVTGDTSLTIATSAVTLPKMQNIATQTFLGRATAGAGNVEALTVAQMQTLLGFSTQTLGNSTSNLIVSNTVQRAALTGDVTASQNSNATTIANSVVTNAKMVNMGIGIKGRNTGTGAPLDLTVAQVQTMLGVVTPNNGLLTLATGTGLTGGVTFGANQATAANFTVGIASTHVLPTTANVTNWNTAFGYGNHATQGYLKVADIAGKVNKSGDTMTGNLILPKVIATDSVDMGATSQASMKYNAVDKSIDFIIN